jgi:hypothetical protein
MWPVALTRHLIPAGLIIRMQKLMHLNHTLQPLNAIVLPVSETGRQTVIERPAG